jgi:hypothetical protein
MFGHFGFSYLGLIYMLMLIIPNIFWAMNKPVGYDPTKENKLLLALERTGQILCTTTVLLFSDYNPIELDTWIIWLFLSAAFMILYEINWIRYFRSSQTVHDFYRSIFVIPVPGAVLPIVSFLLLGIYGKVVWLVISSIVLGIGHIGIHLQHLQQLNSDSYNNRF